MRAGVVTPGQAHSGRVEEIPVPTAGPGECVVQTLEIGICGTDMEIDRAEYGQAPPDSPYLILGHESLGRVLSVPLGERELKAGDLVAGIVRRPCPECCPSCADGQWDMCETGHYTERGIKAAHGFMSERYTESPAYLVRLPQDLRSVGVLTEPMSVVEKGIDQVFRAQQRLHWVPRRAVVLGAGPIGLLAAMLLRLRGIAVTVCDQVEPTAPRAKIATDIGGDYQNLAATSLTAFLSGKPLPDLIVEATGYSPLVFEAAQCLGRNGALLLTAVTGGKRTVGVDTNLINADMVLENHIILGSVNANRDHFLMAVRDLGAIHVLYPLALEAIITRRIPLAQWTQGLTKDPGDIKAVVEVQK